jgi:hypothetical protein
MQYTKKGKRMEQLVDPNELKKQVLIFPCFYIYLKFVFLMWTR